MIGIRDASGETSRSAYFFQGLKEEQSGDWFHFRHQHFSCLRAVNSTSGGRNYKLFGNIEDNARVPPECLYNM